MPRIPQPGGCDTHHDCKKPHHVSPVNADINIKLKAIEDRLRKEYAPRDLLLLDELQAADGVSLLYIYDANEPEILKRLKRIAVPAFTQGVKEDIEKDIDKFAIKYVIMSALPAKGELNTIYLVPTAEEPTQFNVYDEFLWLEQKQRYEKISGEKIDLSVYRTAAEQDIIDEGLNAKINVVDEGLIMHTGDESNPHNVTKAQIGLGNVDDTSDADKPISTATQAALDEKQAIIEDIEEIRAGAAAGDDAMPAENSMTDGEIEDIWNATEGE